jgi:hypothetical protein
MNRDEQLVLDMISEWKISEHDLPTMRPSAIQARPIPRLSMRSLQVPRPSPRRTSLIAEPLGVVCRKVFDTLPPPANYDDLKVESWAR